MTKVERRRMERLKVKFKEDAAKNPDTPGQYGGLVFLTLAEERDLVRVLQAWLEMDFPLPKVTP